MDFLAPISLQACLISLLYFSLSASPPPAPDGHIFTSFLTSTVVPDRFAAFDLFVPAWCQWRSGLDESRLSGRDPTCHSVIDDVSGDGALTSVG